MLKCLQIIGTKADKLGRNDRSRNLAAVKRLFPAAFPPIAYSSLKQDGKNELLHMVYGSTRMIQESCLSAWRCGQAASLSFTVFLPRRRILKHNRGHLL